MVNLLIPAPAVKPSAIAFNKVNILEGTIKSV